MFYYVEGTVALTEPSLAVIDCGGVGYACSTSRTTSAQLKPGQKTRLYTHFYCREDLVQMFGFLELEELNCFRMLLGVSGVGPKAALAILSEAPPSKLALSIITGDAKLLMQAPGIGKKIAQRIVLELRDKMGQGQGQAETGAATLPAQTPGGVNHTQEEVAALMVLGYSQAEALQAMEGCPAETTETEGIIRYCLKRLAGS